MNVNGSLDTTQKVMRHLSVGNQRQQDAYRVLDDSGLLAMLAAYSAYPAGTVPIDVDLPDSDLDVLCHVDDLNAFQAETRSQLEGVALNGKTQWIYGVGKPNYKAYVTCELKWGTWPVEIFAQSVPVYKQNAYLHMQVEWSLLQLWEEAGHREIRKLKQQGGKQSLPSPKY